MAMTLSQYQTRVLQLLSDPAQKRFSTDLITEAARQALKDFSQTAPRIVITTLTLTTARVISLSTLTDLLYPVAIIYPYDANIAPEDQVIQPFYFYQSAGVPTVELQGPDPIAGAALRITYAAAHTINGLDSAAVTTIMTVHESFLIIGIAAYALDQRAGLLAETYGQRSTDVTRILSQAESYHTHFNNYCSALKTFSNNLFPQGFALDQWDKGKRF